MVSDGAEPAVTYVGRTPAMTGRGMRTLKFQAFDNSPPGGGVDTVINAGPALS